jgi:putative transposase
VNPPRHMSAKVVACEQSSEPGAWAPTASLMGLPGMPTTLAGVRLRAERSGWPTRSKQASGGGREYLISALPPETQVALAQASATAVLDPSTKADAKLQRALQRAEQKARRHERMQKLRDVVFLPEWSSAQTNAKLRVLTHYDLFAEQRPGEPRAAIIRAFIAGWTAQRLPYVPPEDYAARPRVSFSTLERWVVENKKHGVYALIPQYGTRKGARLIDTQPALSQLVKGLMVEFPQIAATQVARAIEARITEPSPGVFVDTLNGEVLAGLKRLPSLRAVQSWIDHWKTENAQLWTAITNPDQHRSRYQSASGRADTGIERANQEWQLDSTPTDILLADGKRHAILGVIDVCSRRLKFHVSRTSNARGVCSLLRRAMLDWGVPERIKTDNGTDYTSEHVRRVVRQMEIDHRVSQPFAPEQKPFIERAFGTLNRDLMPLLPGFIGHSVAQRKAIESRRSFAQRHGGEGAGPAMEASVTPDELQAMLDAWCENYETREHRGLKGLTPWEKWCSAQASEVTRIDDERVLDVLLAAPAGGSGDGGRTVTKKGIAVDGGWYHSDLLAGLEGTRVHCRTDDRDFGVLYVFGPDGTTFICQALDYERLGISPDEVVAARRARQKRAMTEGRRSAREIAKAVEATNIVHDILAARARASQKVVMLPRRAVQHATRAVDEAAKATKDALLATSSTSSVTPLHAPLHGAAAAAAESTPEVNGWALESLERYAFWALLHARIGAGHGLQPAHRAFYERYPASSEFRMQQGFVAEFALDITEYQQAAWQQAV